MLDALSEVLKRIEPDFPIKISLLSNTPSEMRVSGLPEINLWFLVSWFVHFISCPCNTMANLGWKYFFLLGSHLLSLWIITSLPKIQHQSNIYSIEITFYVLIANSKYELKKLKNLFSVRFVFAKKYESFENCHNLGGDKSK